MYLIAIAWLYVALMMAAAEATSTQGSVLGAIFTFLLYGVLPMAVLMYILGTPARRRARLAQERADTASHEATAAPGDTPSLNGGSHIARDTGPSVTDTAATATQPDGGRHAPGGPVAAERIEP